LEQGGAIPLADRAGYVKGRRIDGQTAGLQVGHRQRNRPRPERLAGGRVKAFNLAAEVRGGHHQERTLTGDEKWGRAGQIGFAGRFMAPPLLAGTFV
jgi:hypothetical protein